jgi:hypothetical protein
MFFGHIFFIDKNYISAHIWFDKIEKCIQPVTLPNEDISIFMSDYKCHSFVLNYAFWKIKIFILSNSIFTFSFKK